MFLHLRVNKSDINALCEACSRLGKVELCQEGIVVAGSSILGLGALDFDKEITMILRRNLASEEDSCFDAWKI